ncbi:MAG: MBL fold metallo-hydrolase, partial [Promethearchaeota archaeon]
MGTVQDAGSPHIACNKDCCRELFEKPDKNRKVVSLGLIDPQNNKKFLFEATPDMTVQMKILKAYSPIDVKETPDGIFVTHAHIGHYTGLMYLGKEAMSADNVKVYAMPAMKEFLENNGPWSQLVSNHNISIQEITNEKLIILTSNLNVIPFTVPHRDEYSETVGFTIIGPNKKVLFIPDIDKWEKWNRSIVEEISKVDYAFIDATFYDGEEINNRDISEIPHPFIIESMSLFQNLPPHEKSKIYFIHLNHTNP